MSADPSQSSSPFEECSACRCDECRQFDDDFINGIKDLTNAFKELTAKRGVIRKVPKEIKKLKKVKKAIIRSLSQVKKKRKISSPTLSGILPMSDLNVEEEDGDFELKTVTSTCNGPFEGYPIGGDSEAEVISSFSEWIREGLLPKHAQKKEKEGHYSSEYSGLGFKELDFVEAFPEKKDWFYLMAYPNNCWNDEYLDVILYYLRKKSKKQSDASYQYTTTTCFFKTFLFGANDSSKYAQNVVDIIKGYSISAGLPWHLTDEVYIPLNIDDAFHWVLAVVVLKERCIKVYDSMWSPRNNRKNYSAIDKLATMLPQYIKRSDLFEQNVRTNWSSLDCYQDDEKSLPFDVVNVGCIAQQASDSLDCGVFVAAYAEYLSDGVEVPCSGLVGEALRLRYASLLWNYGVKKAENGDVSDSDDPRKRRPKRDITAAPDENLMVTIE